MDSEYIFHIKFQNYTDLYIMASQLSPSAPNLTPPRHNSRSNIPSPDQSPYRITPEVTPSRSKSPVSAQQKARNKTAQSKRALLQFSPETTPHSDRPKIPSELRPTVRKEAISSPNYSSKAEAGPFYDDSILIQGLKKERINSPCSNRTYVRKDYLAKHQLGCDDCKKILKEKEQAQDIHETASDSKQLSATKLDETCQVKAILEANGGPDPNPELQLPTHDQCKSKEMYKAVGKSPSADSSSSVNKESAKADGAIDSGMLRSKMPHQTPLGLEDEPDLEETQTPISPGIPVGALELHNRLREKLESRLTPKDQQGYIYILFDPERPHLHKIGKATYTNQRNQDIKYKCNLNLKLVHHGLVNYYTRTEALIHTDLTNLCRRYTCSSCGTKHGEWFEITKESAIESMERWVKFMRQENPYVPESKELQPFLKNLVKEREHLYTDKHHNFKDLRKHWDLILSPTFIDRFKHRFNVIWKVVWKFYWPVNAVFASTVAFVAFSHPATFVFMVMSVIGTFITLCDEIDHLSHVS